MNTRMEATVAQITREELGEVLAVTRELAHRELAPRALEVDDRSAAATNDCWQAVSEVGLDRAILREDEGGAGVGLAGLLALVEELAVGEGGIATLALLSNAALAVLAPSVRGGLDGATRTAMVALPQQGTPGSRGLRFADDRVSGHVVFALGALGAGTLVLAGHDGDGQGVYTVDAGGPGVTVTAIDDQLGLKGAPAARIDLEDAPVQNVGAADEVSAALTLLNAGIAAVARGVARRAHEICFEYAQNRYQGGSMIIEYGAVIDMIARISERNRVIAGAAAFDGVPVGAGGAQGREALAQALAAKAAATEAAADSTTDAVQSMGGMGYMHETGVEKLMRDARYCQLYPQSNWLAREDLVRLERG
jgi:alkylation response protein AidB-like acyl-CoA dehydrogenase